jgi:hypothetical protein
MFDEHKGDEAPQGFWKQNPKGTELNMVKETARFRALLWTAALDFIGIDSDFAYWHDKFDCHVQACPI